MSEVYGSFISCRHLDKLAFPEGKMLYSLLKQLICSFEQLGALQYPVHLNRDFQSSLICFHLLNRVF